MTQQSPPTGTRTVTDQELEIAFSGAALFVNKFYVTLSGQIARIAFTEQQAGKEPVFRSAVAMNMNDLVQLRDVLNSMTKNLTTVQITTPKSNA